MTLEAILARLRGVRSNASGWIARCPAHEDRSPSLSVAEGEGGRVLLHCFAGCSPDSIVAALGLKLSDLFFEPGVRRKPEPRVVRDAQKRLTGLRSRLTPREHERAVIVVLADEANLDAAIARALALAVEGELVQIAFDGGDQ
jgi:hypothetical protein